MKSGFAAAVTVFGFALGAVAQGYPSRPVRIVVGFPPGGTNDIIARVVAQKLPNFLGQQVIVENRPGAAGTISGEFVARAAPDGYTLIMGATSNMAIAASLSGRLPYDPAKDFAPITQVAASHNVLVVHPSVPAKSVKELITLAKSRPGKLNYGSPGSGTTPHLAVELLKTSVGGLAVVHIPYKGAGPALADLVSGQIDFVFSGLAGALPYVQAGKLRALGIGGFNRSAALPEVPTLIEAGVPNFEASSWNALLAPAGTSQAIIARIYGATLKCLQSAGVRERLTALGAEPIGDTPEQFGAYLRAEIAKWAKVVKVSDAKPD